MKNLSEYQNGTWAGKLDDGQIELGTSFSSYLDAFVEFMSWQ